jgi:hypothetical protein
MDFLLLTILVLWSFGACFLPLRERLLRVIVMANTVGVSLALLALVVPAIRGERIAVLNSLFVVDTLRALLAIPLAISWIAGVAAFVMWWGASFKSGVGTRPLFCLRSATLVGSFAGVLLVLLTDSLSIMLTGLLIAFLMACVGVLFQAKEDVLARVRMFAIGCGAALMLLIVGVGFLEISGYQQTSTLLLVGAEVRAAGLSGNSILAMLGIAVTGFSAMWFMGLLPGMAWYRRGMANLPKGHRLVMRVFLPAALFPHLLTLAAWGGESGSDFVQKMLLLFSLFAGLAAIEYIRTKEETAETSAVFLLALTLVALAFGPAGAIPALMLVMMFVLWGAALLISRGGISWSRRTRAYAVAILAGIPVVSPFFVPFALGLGYGIQMMPVVAVIVGVFLIWSLFILTNRITHAWSEGEGTYADLWSGRVSMLLLFVMTVYGCWFMYADALALLVKSVGV